VATATLEVEGSGLVLRAGPFEQVGVYTVDMGSRRTRVAVNADVSESDLRVSSGAELRGTVGGAASFVDATESIGETARAATSEISDWFLWGLLGMLVLESHVARRFGAHR
jgi:hypothetical protein